MLKNGELVSYEEELVKTKYPLLASIIIGNSTYKDQKQEKSWEQEAPHYVEVPYTDVSYETQQTQNDDQQNDNESTNNWQHYLLNPAFDTKKQADYHAEQESPNGSSANKTPAENTDTLLTLDGCDDPSLNDFNDIFNYAVLTNSDTSSNSSSYFTSPAW